MFALTLYILILMVQDACNFLIQTWYLDDGTLIVDLVEVAKALSII